MKQILIFTIILELGFLIFLFLFFGIYSKGTKTDETMNTSNFIPQEIELTGWFAAWDDEKVNETLPAVMSQFETFSPMLYRVMPDSSLGEHDVSTRNIIIQTARNHNIPIAPVITDESDEVRIEKLLTEPDTQKGFIRSLVEEAKIKDFIGWSIDIEQLKGSDRQAFSIFIQKVSEKLHENELKLYVIVYGRQEDENYDPARAHDFKVLGQYADQVQIMTYNYNNEFTSPGGQTPLDWYRSVLRYATDNIPREKILVGLSTHGYSWNSNSVTGLTYPQVEELIERYDLKVKYDAKHSSQIVSYEDESGLHEIWFEDAKTINEKMEIAQVEFGINKFAFWRLSAEDPDIWNLMRNKNR